ncbi:permease prefix domain 1-containing protein [Agromyces sp. H3Y2-19a]|uniref:permease prefix domain 1-containing protein n=1 Tax=Agromyces TaxID=33877 RepID=UPI001E402DF9|nr:MULTISPECIES: permease prefix domain 1-containing protein [Agromyces]MCD5346728.1 permease prefix domain 1-containing protein [Agromyces sp. S2-1-8]MDF0513090.1 permease prefix domain 1-containing protein [Agromyces chromiiresistens]
MSDNRSPRTSTEVHRLLDEAFAGIDPTPEAQDLKEEIRDNLLSRVAELEVAGASPVEAARRAVDELGDVRELVAAATGDADASAPAAPAARAARPAASAAQTALRHRVRPKPAFVVRTVVLSIVAAAALVTLVLGLTPLMPLAAGPLIAIAAALGLAIGVITADALRQETTTNYPLPTGRAVAFGAATGTLVASLGFAAVVVWRLELVWLVLAAVLAVAAIAVLSALGATQTNRHKPWVVAMHRDAVEVGNRFEQDPAAAARFGIYSAVIWLTAFALVPVLGFTVGWWWAPLPVVAAFIVMMLVLARMLFGHDARSSH